MTHDDGYSLYWPNGPEPSSFHHNNPAFKALMQTFSDHMFRMADTDIPEAYPMSDIVPVITLLECQPEQWIRSIYNECWSDVHKKSQVTQSHIQNVDKEF